MNVLDQVANHLETLELKFQRDEHRIELGFKAEQIRYDAFITGDEHLVTIVAPNIATVPDQRSGEVIRLANLLNAHYMRFGTFWVSIDGRLGFELQLLPFGGLSQQHIMAAMAALSAVDVFFPAFAQVSWAGKSVEDVLGQAQPEAPPEPSNDEGASDDDDDGPIVELRWPA